MVWKVTTLEMVLIMICLVLIKSIIIKAKGYAKYKTMIESMERQYLIREPESKIH